MIKLKDGANKMIERSEREKVGRSKRGGGSGAEADTFCHLSETAVAWGSVRSSLADNGMK